MLYLFGWNSLSKVIISALNEESIEVDGVVMSDDYISEDIKNNCEFKIYSLNSITFNKGDEVINCLGYKDLNKRKIIGEKLLGLKVLRSFISQKADVSKSAKILHGAILLGNVTIESDAIVGNHSIIWGGARVCHGAHLGDAVFMASGSIVGGNSTLGNFVKIGFNSAIRQETTVPDGTSIGACNYYSA